MIKLSFFSEKLSQCCEIDSLPISLCSEDEKLSLKEFLSEGKSVLVLAHHVTQSLEWVWFPFEAERNNVTCAADLHLKSECEKIVSELEKKGYKSTILPYPGRCGVRFKDLANKTGLGKMGDNYMFLHRQWGAWTQLRVIVTEAEISDNLPTCDQVCNHCGLCKTACPINAIKDDTLLGIQCNEYQGRRDTEIGMEGSNIFKCEKCARACPIGDSPESVNVSKL